MTTADMLTAIQHTLASDARLLSWCQQHAGALPTVQIDFDEDERLQPDSPALVILAVQQQHNIQQRRNLFTVKMVAIVRNETITRSSHQAQLADGASVTVPLRVFEGRLVAEGLREQAVSALYRGRLGKVTMESDSFSHTYFPSYYAPLEVTIEEQM